MGPDCEEGCRFKSVPDDAMIQSKPPAMRDPLTQQRYLGIVGTGTVSNIEVVKPKEMTATWIFTILDRYMLETESRHFM